MNEFKNFVKSIYNICDSELSAFDDEFIAIADIKDIFNARHKSIKLVYLLICQKWHEYEMRGGNDYYACRWYEHAAEAVEAYAREMAA